MKRRSLQEINDYYFRQGYRGEKLRRLLSRDKEYQQILKERKKQLTKQFKIHPREHKKYVLSTDSDFVILGKCKQLEKYNLSAHDSSLVHVIKAQLEDDWRKSLIKRLDKMLKKYA